MLIVRESVRGLSGPKKNAYFEKEVPMHVFTATLRDEPKATESGSYYSSLNVNSGDRFLASAFFSPSQAKALSKGDKIGIEGYLRSRKVGDAWFLNITPEEGVEFCRVAKLEGNSVQQATTDPGLVESIAN